MKTFPKKLFVKFNFLSRTYFPKSLLLFILLVQEIRSPGQSIDLGLSGGISSAWLFNTNVLSGKGDQAYRPALSYNYGFHSTINFAHGYGLEIEIQKAQINQAYGGIFGGSGSFPAIPITYYSGESYSANTQINILKFPVLFRYEKELSGRYVEAGLAYDIIQGGTYSASYKNPDQSVGLNISSELPKGNFIAVAGLGWDKLLSHGGNLYLHFGFRLEYGLFDLMGVDGHGQDLNGSKSVILYEDPKPYYSTDHTTHSVELSFNVGMFYRIYPKSMMHKRVVDF